MSAETSCPKHHQWSLRRGNPHFEALHPNTADLFRIPSEETDPPAICRTQSRHGMPRKGQAHARSPSAAGADGIMVEYTRPSTPGPTRQSLYLSSRPAHAGHHVIGRSFGKQLDSATWSGVRVIGTDVKTAAAEQRAGFMGRVGASATRPAGSTSGTRRALPLPTFRSIFEAIKAARSTTVSSPGKLPLRQHP